MPTRTGTTSSWNARWTPWVAGALLVAAVVCLGATTASAPATHSALDQKGAMAKMIGGLIVVLVLFVLFVVLSLVLRHRLAPPRRRGRPEPTDASDLWSLPGQAEARRKTGRPPPTTKDRPHGQ
jgi:hypothetical protein